MSTVQSQWEIKWSKDRDTLWSASCLDTRHDLGKGGFVEGQGYKPHCNGAREQMRGWEVNTVSFLKEKGENYLQKEIPFASSSPIIPYFPSPEFPFYPEILIWYNFIYLFYFVYAGQGIGLIVAAHKLSFSTACGIFPDQGLNPRLIGRWILYHWVSHQGSPIQRFLTLGP